MHAVESARDKPLTQVCFLDGQCCLSSGPRGLALVPTFAVTTDAEGLVFNYYDQGAGQLSLRNGADVAFRLEPLYPGEDRIRIALNPAVTSSFAAKLRLAIWCVVPFVRITERRQTPGRGQMVMPPCGANGKAATNLS
jgi:DUF1680 family protein